jgi:hypothetical protein
MVILLHEWGHGTVAWLYGLKQSPFDVYYGGWALLHVDEHVDYDFLLATHRGVEAALIGIAGLSVDIALTILMFGLLRVPRIQRNTVLFSLAYWILVMNMLALFQYVPITTFSTQGDIGRFIHGLNISPWLVFIPGTILVLLALWRMFVNEIPKAYAVIPLKTHLGQSLFLAMTLFMIFLLIYTHGYNPMTDKGADLFSKILAILSIIAVPILFLICSPRRQWVIKRVEYFLPKSNL